MPCFWRFVVVVFRKLQYLFVLAGLAALLLAACRKEEYAADETALDFSCDTMAFDTVFTSMGTTTRQFKVYNRGAEAVKIGEVTLEQGRRSRFRLNVDGDTSLVARDLVLAPGDSLFVFVRANINPNSETEPFLIEDAVVFRMETGRMRRLPLTAYGRNAVYHIPTDTLRYADGTMPTDLFGNPYAYSVIDCEHWNHALPHVIVGYAVVDSRCTLRLAAGDELYFCNNSILWVYDSATIEARGEASRPVKFTSARHDGWYDYLPGQWGYIWLSMGSRDNVIDHALIENGYVGILADSCANANPTLAISNTEIRNETMAGLLLQTAVVTGENLLVSNCGTATVSCQYGGSYAFSRCTFANYWAYESRKSKSFYITNTRDYEGVHYVWPASAYLEDCIIYGSRSDGELYVELDNLGGSLSADTVFAHCLIKGGAWDEDPLFVDPQGGDFHLQEGSPARGIGYTYPEATAPAAGRIRQPLKR